MRRVACLGLFVSVGMLAVASRAQAAQPAGVEPGGAGDPTAPDSGSAAGVGGDASAGGDASLGGGASLGGDASGGGDAGGGPDDSLGGSSDGGFDSSTSGGGTVTTTAAAGQVAPSGGNRIDPMKGRFAIGAIRTIAGVNGVNFRYFATEKLSIGASVGVALFSYKENDPTTTDPCPGNQCTFENTRTVAAMGYNLEVLYWAHQGREAGNLPFRADFGVGGRFGVLSVINASDIANNLDDPTEMHIEIPLVMQLMFGNNFALAPELGMDFRIVPGSREKGDTNPGTGQPVTISPDAVAGPGFGWEITPGIGLFAGASMHYYFGR